MENFIKFYCKNWKFWFKLIIVILSLFGLLTDYIENILNLDKALLIEDETGKKNYIWAVYDENGIIKHWNYIGYTISWISFFTTQTNVLVLVWFFIAIIKHLQEEKNKLLKSYFSLSVAVYITITCLIYNFLLLPTALSDNNMNWPIWRWLSQLILHTFIPIFSVIYIIGFTNLSELLPTKLFYKQKLGLFFIYPVIYGIYAILKGLLCEYSGMNPNIAYQYFFLQVTNPNILGLPGIVWLIITSILICGIIISFTGLYNFIYFLIKKYHEKNN